MTATENETLFREQAIRSLNCKPPGRPICLMPKPWRWLSALALLMFAFATVLAWGAEYSRKETVRGWLVSNRGIVRVSNSGAAQIREVVRQPGDHVLKGDPLVYLSSDSTLADGNSHSAEVLEQLRNEIEEVDRQLELSESQQSADKKSLQQQLEILETEKTALAARIRDQQRRLELSSEKLRRLNAARTNGAVTEWDVIRQQEDEKIITQELNRLQQEIAARQRERELLKGRESSLSIREEIQQSSLRARRTRLAQNVAEQESKRMTVLESPVTGTVGSVEVHAGYVVAPRQLLMTVIPENAVLAAEIFVPSSAAGFVQQQQTVRISYDAFPLQKFGAMEGRISFVSDYVLLPHEIPQTFSIREATYKVQVAIDSASVMTSIGEIALRPGMLLSADIVLEQRNLVDWLLEPLLLRRGTAN